jgi:hypothetical protein
LEPVRALQPSLKPPIPASDHVRENSAANL